MHSTPDSQTIGEYAFHETPVGPLLVIADVDGNVVKSGWGNDPAKELAHISPALRPAKLVERNDLGAVSIAIERYLNGDVMAINNVPVAQRGGPFFEQAWQTLRSVPAGEPVSYSKLAAMSGRPRAVRAAASACARNTSALFVPCHRVLRNDGSLGGFAWGLDVKRWLLEHEEKHGSI